jgi:hypothetical protein
MMEKISALELLKQEFMERYGVEIQVDVRVFDVSEELAKEIVSDFHKKVEKHEWTTPENRLSGSYFGASYENFKVAAQYYKKEEVVQNA